MNFNDFLSQFTTEVFAKFPNDAMPTIHKMTKNNGRIRYAIALKNAASNASPLVYIDSYYESYCSGTPMEQLVSNFMKEYKQCMSFHDSFPNIPADFEQMKPYIFAKAIHYERNLPWLANIPHKRYLDLAMIYEFIFPHSQNGYGFSAITYSLMELLNLTEEQLHELAWENMRRDNPPETISIKRYVDFNCDCAVYILTNYKKIHGAAYIFDTKTLQAIAEYFESDLYIFPSSIHELIVVPWNDVSTREELSAIVQEVNTEAVEPEEQLSDHVYVFHRNTSKLS